MSPGPPQGGQLRFWSHHTPALKASLLPGQSEPSGRNVPISSFLDPELPNLYFRGGERAEAQTPSFHPKNFLTDKKKKMHIYAEIKEGNRGEQTCLFSQLSQYASDKINTVGPSVLYSQRECLQFRRNTSPSPPLRLLVKRTAVQALLHEPHQWTEGTPTPQLTLCQHKGSWPGRQCQDPSSGNEELEKRVREK